jgi:hypothetical protein
VSCIAALLHALSFVPLRASCQGLADLAVVDHQYALWMQDGPLVDGFVATTWSDAVVFAHYDERDKYQQDDNESDSSDSDSSNDEQDDPPTAALIARTVRKWDGLRQLNGSSSRGSHRRAGIGMMMASKVTVQTRYSDTLLKADLTTSIWLLVLLSGIELNKRA